MKWDEVRVGTVGLVFPGAGITSSGYEALFFERYRGDMEPLMDRASEFAGADLSAALTSDHGLDELGTQLFTCTYSLGMYRAILSRGVVPGLVAGHSLGIYSALAASECVSFADSLALVKAAWDLATAACLNRSCGMLATAGLTLAEVDGLLEQLAAPSLRRVITNSSMSQVVAGTLDELEAFAEKARHVDATRIVWLDRKVAYHHPGFLKDASKRLSEVISGVVFRDPVIPLVSSLDAGLLTRAEQARDFTVKNLSSPIDWQAVLLAFDEHGVKTVFETGPGTTLTRMGRFVDTGFKYLNVKKIIRRNG